MNEITRNEEKYELSRHIREALRSLTYLISATPTGAERNKLCDVQIHLMSAQSLLEKP